MTTTDVLVIGAGQAGLAMGYHLKKAGMSFVILGKEERVGDTWRNRYDSLVLFTPRWFSALPGLPLEGDREGCADKDEIADYLEQYATYHGLPVSLSTEVFSLTKEDGIFHAVTSRGEYRARQVVIASGPFRQPYVPPFAEAASDGIRQVHSSQYRNPSELKDGPVLVVGAGNSGAQIAVELCRDREVYLSSGQKLKHVPLRLLGKSVFWWFGQLGILHAGPDSKVGRYVRSRPDPIFGSELRPLLRQGKIRLRGRVGAIEEDAVLFQDGGAPVRVPNIVWATGFRPDYGWIRIPDALGGGGRPVHRMGASPVEGLFFLGLPWQRTRGSALIGGVGKDAEYLVSNHIRTT